MAFGNTVKLKQNDCVEGPGLKAAQIICLAMCQFDVAQVRGRSYLRCTCSSRFWRSLFPDILRSERDPNRSRLYRTRIPILASAAGKEFGPPV